MEEREKEHQLHVQREKKYHPSSACSEQCEVRQVQPSKMKTACVFLLVSAFVAVYLVEETAATGGYGHGHKASGTACIVKGSYCNCHYCKCEKGHVHCGYGKGK